MTDPRVRSTIPNSYVDQKDGFSKKKKSATFPQGGKRNQGEGKNGTPRQKETWRDKKITRQFGEKGKS